MSKTLHDPYPAERPLSQNERASDTPGDGGRRSDPLGREGEDYPREGDGQDPSTIEAFDEEGAGIAPKE